MNRQRLVGVASRMTGRAGWIRGACFLLAVGLTGGLVGIVVRSSVSRLERASVDARFAIRGHRPAPKRIVIVAFDNETLRRVGRRPPIDRRIQARLLDRLDRAGAEVVAFDYSIEQPSRRTPDLALIQALYDTRHAVVSVTAPSSDGSVASLAGLVPFAPPVRPGYTGLPVDPQGVVRTFARPPGKLASFAIAAAEAFSKRNLAVPSRALIDYPGPSGTVPRLSYIRVLNGRFPRALVDGKIVIVGSTATVLGDRHRVPTARAMPGAEIHAAAMETALDGFSLRRVSAVTADRTTGAVGFVVPALLLLGGALLRRGSAARLSAPDPLGAVAVTVGVGVAWSVAAQIAFDEGRVLEVVPGLCAIVASGVMATGLAAALSKRDRRIVRARFAANDLTIVREVLAAGRRRRIVDGSEIIPGYAIREVVESGGMGVVYRARQHRLDRDIALKLIRQEYAVDLGYRTRFVDEAFKASAVAHPNIMPVVDAGEADGVLFIAMPFVPSSTLATSIAMVGGLPPEWAIPVLHRVACALDAAFDEEGLLHRDVKPGNILVPHRSPLHPYVIDFGIATVADVESSWHAGTPEYLAPERRLGRDSRAGDVYALGVTLFECIAGLRPRGGQRLSEVRPGLPRAIDDVIEQATAADPADRHASASAFTLEAAGVLGVAVSADADADDRGDGLEAPGRLDPVDSAGPHPPEPAPTEAA